MRKPLREQPTKLRRGQDWILPGDEVRVRVKSVQPLHLQRFRPHEDGIWREGQWRHPITAEDILAGECYYDPEYLLEDEIPAALEGRTIVTAEPQLDSGVTLTFADGGTLQLDAVWHNDSTAGLYIT